MTSPTQAFLDSEQMPTPARSAHSDSWDKAAASLESNNTVKGPISRSVDAPMAHLEDQLAALPPKARDKLQALEDTQADFRTLKIETQDRRNETGIKKTKDAHRLATLTDPATSMRDGDGFVYGPENPSVIDAQGNLDRTTEKYERVSEKSDALTHRMEPTGQLLSHCKLWIKQNGGVPIAAYGGEAPKTRRGQTYLEAIEKIRQERAVLEADLHTIQSAPQTSEECKQAVRCEIEQLAKAGQPDVYSLLERGRDSVGWSMRQIKATLIGTTLVATPEGNTVYPGGIAHDSIPNTLALVAWLLKDRLLEEVERLIDSISDDTNALTVEDRAAKEASILSSILSNERNEEWHCEQNGKQGTGILPRPDMDPRAYLGVQGPPLKGW